MRLAEFLQRLDDKLDTEISSLDVEIEVREREGSYGFDLVLIDLEDGREIGSIKF